METATKQLIPNVKKFVKHWYWQDAIVEKDRPDSDERMSAVMLMSSRATIHWTVRKVEKKFISVDKRCIRTYVRDALESVTDCYVQKAVHAGQIKPMVVPAERNEVWEQLD